MQSSINFKKLKYYHETSFGARYEEFARYISSSLGQIREWGSKFQGQKRKIPHSTKARYSRDIAGWAIDPLLCGVQE